MATATFSSGEFSGGSDNDRLNLTTCAAAASELTLVYDNVAYQTTAEAETFTFAADSFSDFTGAVLMLRNGSNNEEIAFRLGGDVIVGREGDLNDRGFELVVGNRDLFNTHLDEIDICDLAAQVVCRNERTRIVVRHVLDIGATSLTGEPGARNGIRVQNNNTDSRLRLTILGGRAALDSDYPGVGTGGGQYGANKPAGTEIFKWQVSDDVPVRDFEWYAGYCDWRMDGDWAPPTRAVFASESGIKFLVNSDAGRPDNDRDDPLIFGGAADPFVLNLGTVANSWWLEGIASTEDDFRIVYLNTDGPNWATQVALFGQNRAKVIENHLVVDYRIIDALGRPIEDALVRMHSRDPQISAPASSGVPEVNFPAANARINTSTSNAEGTGSLGGATGAYNQAVVVEALGRRITGAAGGTGTVDGAYASAAHAKVDYGSHNALTYDVFSFGRQILTGVAWTAALSGQDGAGKQTLGVIQLNDETNLTAADAASVPARAATFDDVFDILYGWAIASRAALPFAATTGNIDFGSLDVTFSAAGALAVDLAGGAITVPCAATLAPGAIHMSLETTGTFAASGVTITGRITDANGTPSTVTVIADDGDMVAYYLADGTEISRSTLSGTDRVTFGLTPAQSAAGQRISVAKSGFESRIRTLSTAGGGSFTTDMASLVEKRGPDGRAQFDSSNLDARVSVAFDLTDLAAVSSKIDIGNAQVRAAHAFNRFEIQKLTSDGMKYVAFGGAEPGILQDPVNGDALYLPSEVMIRRAAAGDSNATMLATVYHTDGTPVDNANGDVSIVGGRILADFAQEILANTDLDLDRVGLQSLAGLLVNVRKELVTHGIGGELTVIDVNPRDDSQRDTLLRFRPADDLMISGTEVQVFSRLVNDGILSLYLIGTYSFSGPISLSRGVNSTTLTAADEQSEGDDLDEAGHWLTRETTILGFLLDMRDRIDAIPTDAVSDAPTVSEIVAGVQAADFEAGAGTNSLAQVLAQIRTDIGNVGSSGSGSGSGGADSTEVLDGLGRIIYGSDYRGAWIAGEFPVGMYVRHDGIYYRSTAARTASDTDDPATDSAGWEVAGINSTIMELASTTHGLAALKTLIDSVRTDVAGIPAAPTPPTVSEIVTGIQEADFEVGAGTKTIAQLLEDIIMGETIIENLEEDILAAIGASRMTSQSYTMGAGTQAGTFLIYFNTAFPDDQFLDSFKTRADHDRFPTALTFDSSDPPTLANIQLTVAETATGTDNENLSDRFGRNWEMTVEYSGTTWTFRHDDFDVDLEAPYRWTTTEQAVLDDIDAMVTAIGSNSGAVITFFVPDPRTIDLSSTLAGLGDGQNDIDSAIAAVKGVVDGIPTDAAPSASDVASEVFSSSFSFPGGGSWTLPGALESIQVTVTSDTVGLSALKDLIDAVPTASEIVAAVQAADFLEGADAGTLEGVLADIKSAVDGIPTAGATNALGSIVFGAAFRGTWEAGTWTAGQYSVFAERYYRCDTDRMASDTDDPATDAEWTEVEIHSAISNLVSSAHGLAALKTLIDDIPTSNPTASEIAAAVEGSAVGTGVASIKSDVESPDHGLAALEDLVEAVHAADAAHVLGAALYGSSYKGTWEAGIYAVGDYALFGGTYYRATAARDATHTDDPATDSASWEVAEIHSLIEAIPTENPTAAQIAAAVNEATVGTDVASIKTAIENATYGLSALQTLLDGIPTTDDPTAAEIVTAIQGADFLEGTESDTLEGVLASIKTVVDGITPARFDALGHLIFGEPYRGIWEAGTYAAGDYSLHGSLYYRCLEARTAANVDSPPSDAAGWEVAEIYSHVTPVTDSTNGLAALRTLVIRIPTTNPSASDVATAIDSAGLHTDVDAIRAAIESASYGLAAIDSAVSGVPGETARIINSATIASNVRSLISMLGASIFGSRYKGEWAAGPYDVGDVVWYVQFFYECGIARTSSHTNNPVLDTASWSVAARPTSEEIASAVQAADFGSEAGTQTLAQVLAALKMVADANKSALEDGTSGLQALKTVVDANKGLLEDGTHGLAALQALLAALPTDFPETDAISAATAAAVRDLEVVTGADLKKSLQILLAVMIGRVRPQGSNLQIHTPGEDDELIVTVPKFQDGSEARPGGADIEE